MSLPLSGQATRPTPDQTRRQKPVASDSRSPGFAGHENAGPRAATMLTSSGNCGMLGINPEEDFIDGLFRVCGTPAETEAWPRTQDENQATTFPEDIDQRPPELWEARQWEQTSPGWHETPLAQWAAEANPWDGIDSIPPEDEPVFYTD